MTVVQWTPFRDLVTIQRQMDRLLDSYARSEEYEARDFVPAIEVLVTDHEVLVNCELPGVDPNQVDLQVGSQQITLSGTRSAPEVENIQGQRSEITYGKFYRRIGLPHKIQPEQVTAKYDHGVLRLVLPRQTEQGHKLVKVDIAH
jgi:HSP20 family protein